MTAAGVIDGTRFDHLLAYLAEIQPRVLPNAKGLGSLRDAAASVAAEAERCAPAGEVEARDLELLAECARCVEAAAIATIRRDHETAAIACARSSNAASRLNERWRGR